MTKKIKPVTALRFTNKEGKVISLDPKTKLETLISLGIQVTMEPAGTPLRDPNTYVHNPNE